MLVAVFGTKLDSKYRMKLESLFALLKSKGVSLCYYRKVYDVLRNQMELYLPDGEVFDSYDNLPAGTTHVLVLGGDGTFLNSLSLIKSKPIAVAGVNLGRVGFLTSVVLDEKIDSWLDELISGDYKIEHRLIMQLHSTSGKDIEYPYALNEIAFQRNSPSMLGIEISIDGDDVPIYWADGLLIATPTGSTAYSLSVGGPIVKPGSNVFIIAPVAPHNLNVRPLIVPDTSVIKVKLHCRSSKALLSIDSNSFTIDADEMFELKKADFKLNYISSSSCNFFEVLREKLFWGEDKRNNDEDS